MYSSSTPFEPPPQIFLCGSRCGSLRKRIEVIIQVVLCPPCFVKWCFPLSKSLDPPFIRRLKLTGMDNLSLLSLLFSIFFFLFLDSQDELLKLSENISVSISRCSFIAARYSLKIEDYIRFFFTVYSFSFSFENLTRGTTAFLPEQATRNRPKCFRGARSSGTFGTSLTFTYGVFQSFSFR